MRLATRVLVVGLFATSTAVAQPPASEFAADRSPPVAVRAATIRLPTADPPLPAPKEAPATVEPRPANTLPIDLPTPLRLANAASPTIAIAQARVREALAHVDQADALKLPTLAVGGIYDRHDGIDQNRNGSLLTVS